MIHIMIIINNHSYKIIIGKLTKKNNIVMRILLVIIYKYIELYINFNVSKFKIFQ